MCRHETATYACGHKQDLGFFCEHAKSYGALFNKVNCPNYSHGAEKLDQFNQCGKQGGFYCAMSQDGVVIDKAKLAQNTANAQFNIRKNEFQHIALKCTNYLQEAKARSVPPEELAKHPIYSKLEQQRQLLGSHCTVLRNRAIYFNNLLNHAFGNRNLLAPGVCRHPEWDPVSFDFDRSIFSPGLLKPILHLLPGHGPPLTAPAGPYLPNIMNQYPGQTQSSSNEMLSGPGPEAPPVPQVKSTQRPKLKVTTTPIKQMIVTEEGSPMSSEIIRGHTPEGEGRMARAARYRAQLTDSRKVVISDAMVDAGYDVETHGIRPPPGKQGSRQTPKKVQSPVANVNNPAPIPKKVRRSTRARNNKPKYAEGSDDSLGSDGASPHKPDSVWNDSPGKSDPAWVDTPTKFEASSSPVKPTRKRNNRATQRFTGSPNDSPTQALLSSRISDHQRRTGSMNQGGTANTTAAPTQFGNLFEPRTRTPQATSQAPSADTAQAPLTDPVYHQNMQMSTNPGSNSNNFATGGVSSSEAYGQGWLQSSHTAQQRSAAMERGAHLIQEFGQTLHQHQIASGMIGAAQADVIQSPHTQQFTDSSGMMFAPPAQMVSVMPYSESPKLHDSPNAESPASPMNIFHRNLNQARAAGAILPSQGRSFSTGSLPFSSQPVVASPLSPTHHIIHQSTPMRADYENMRRTISSTTNLTPQHSFPHPHPTSVPEPSKRSLPPASPTLGRKRQRLSFPGEDTAPTLTPSQSKHQLHAPAGLPADNNIDFAAEIAAIEMFEKQNMAELAALDTARSNIDPGLHSEHDFSNFATALPDTSLQAGQSIPIDPQLYEDYSAPDIVQSTEESPVDPSAPSTEQSSTQPLQVPATPALGFLDGSSSPLSEPDWSLLNDDAF